MNRGFLNGPLCPVYGVGMVLILLFFGSLKGNFVFLALGCSVMAAVVEFLPALSWKRYSGANGGITPAISII